VYEKSYWVFYWLYQQSEFSRLRLWKKLHLNQKRNGLFKSHAVDANNPAANQELTKTIDYFVKKTTHQGYTSIIYKTPQMISAFGTKLKRSQEELQNLKPQRAERTNVLMKLGKHNSS
jgi:hypothetical protein